MSRVVDWFLKLFGKGKGKKPVSPLPSYTPIPLPPDTGGDVIVPEPPVAFTLLSVTPIVVSQSGGETVTVTGTFPSAPSDVTVGGVPVTPFNLTGTTFAFTMPALAAGAYSVAVTVNGVMLTLGAIITVQGTTFTVTGVSPATVTAAGGQTITVTGTGIVSPAATIGGTAVTETNITSTSFKFVMPAKSVGSYDLVVTVGGTPVTLSNAITVTAVSGFPNEPVGLTPLYDHDFNIATIADIDAGAAVGGTSWFAFDADTAPAPYVPSAPGNLTFVNGGPGDASYMRARYPTGWPTGYAPVNVGYSFASNQQQRLYSYIEFMVEDGSGTGANNFEMESPVGQKLLGFWGAVNSAGAGNEVYAMVFRPGSPNSQFVNAMKMTITTQNLVSRNLSPNIVDDFWITVGVKHTMELEMVINSGPGVADGIVRMWGDGQLKIEYTNVVFRTSSFPTGGFYSRKYNPTYGGASGAAAKSRTDYVRTFREYGSGTAVPSSDYPNKPAGITTLRYSLNPSNPNTPLAGVNQGTPLPRTNLAVNSGQLETTWPAGLNAGDTVCTAFDMGRDDVNAYQSYYMKARFTLPDPTFTSHEVQSKFLYNRYGDRAANNQGVCMCLFPGGASGNNTPRSTLQMMCQMSQNLSGGSIPIYANTVLRANAFWITTQVEHTYEIYVDVGTPDTRDATLKVWIDGALYMWYGIGSPYVWPNPSEWSGSIVSPTDKGTATWNGTWINPDGSSTFKMLDTVGGAFTVGFYGIHFAPVWGGTGGTPSTKQQTDHHRFSQLDYFVGAVKP